MATLGTFVAGQVLTAAELNAIGTWTTFTTSAVGGTISSQACQYVFVNEMVTVSYRVDFSALSGTVTLSLPVNGTSTAPFNNLGAIGMGLIINGSTYYYVSPYIASSTTVGFYYVANAASASIVNATTPVSAWDNIRCQITYKAA